MIVRTIVEYSKYNYFYYNKDFKFHRTDGPAKVFKDGREEWWLNGVKVNKKEVDKLLVKLPKDLFIL